MNASQMPDPSHNDLFQLRLDDVVMRCRSERSAYRTAGTQTSPACVELFRRAFMGEHEAWAGVRANFERQMRGWIGSQQEVDPDDVVQEAFLAFFRAAPSASLIHGDQLAPIVEYLRQCTKTALLNLARKAARLPQVYLDETFDLPDGSNLASMAEVRLILRSRLAELIETDLERQVFHLRFECNWKPQAIRDRLTAVFDDVDAVYIVIQRLVRRLTKDTEIQQLRGTLSAARQKRDSDAFLSIIADERAEEHEPMDEPCGVNEALLLDYITGVADPDVRAAIERVPACLAAARRLAQEVQPLLPLLYRMSCPSPEQLMAYQEQRLASTEHLIFHRHIAICPLCQDEIRLLTTLDSAPLDPPNLWRRVVEAILQPAAALPQAVRGEPLRYQAAHLAIDLSVRRLAGAARTWTIRGQVRTMDGQLAATTFEAVELWSLDLAEPLERAGRIESRATFVFQDIPSGIYSLHLLTEDEEIRIDRVVVGDGE